MYYTEFEAGGKTYKLRLNTRNLIALEKRIGVNPVSIFGNGDKLPTVTTMVDILFVSLQELQHGINLETAYGIFDDYIADGHKPTDFCMEIVKIYQVSGLLPKEEATAEKN